MNVPLVDDKLALRIVGTESYTDGWIDRVVLDNFPQPTNGGLTRGNVLGATPSYEDKNSNYEMLQGARASLLWKPINNLTITPTILYQEIHTGGPQYVDEPPGPASEVHYQPYNIPEPSSDEFELYSLPISYKLGDVRFDSITAYYHRLESAVVDATEQTQDFSQTVLGVGPITFAQLGPESGFEADTSTQFSQELRISSAGSDPFQWLAGFYYQDFSSTSTIGISEPSAYFASLLGPAPLFNLSQKTTIKQYAGFGEASYKLWNFKLTAGVRYYSYNTGGGETEYGSIVTGGGPSTAETNPLPSSSSGFNPRVNLSYEPSRDLTLYAQAAKGFRPGAGNAPAPTSCPAVPTQYRPDSVWSYEAGEKARFFNRAVTFNADVYYEDFSGIQQTIALACGYAYTGNAGTAHIYGSEVEAAWRITSELTLNTGFGYTHATLASVQPGTGFTTGERLQAVPQYTETTNLVYTHRLNDTYNAVFRAQNEYVGNQQDTGYTIEKYPSRDLVNLRFGFASPAWSAWLFANNVANDRTGVATYDPVTFLIPSLNRAVMTQPRTVGIELDYAFGGH